MSLIDTEQIGICQRFGADFLPTAAEQKVGLSRDFSAETYPLNGLRLLPEVGTSGWFIWSGETFSEDADFFVPLHSYHLAEICPALLPYLGIPPDGVF